MATLKLFYRTSKKNIQHINLRVRFSIDRDTQFHATLPTTISVKHWDNTLQRLKLESKPKDFRTYSIDEQNDIVEKIDKLNAELIATNDLLNNLCDYITTAYNRHIGNFASEWLQTIVDDYYKSLKCI